MTLAVSLALLVAPIALAQNGNSGKPNQTDCGEDANSARCQNQGGADARPAANESRNDEPDGERAKDFCQNNARSNACRTDSGEDLSNLRHIAFTLNREGRALENVAIGDRAIFDAILLPPGELSAENKNGVLQIEGDSWVLRFHDNPTGLLSYKGNQTLQLVVPANVSIEETQSGARLDYGNYTVLLSATELQVDGQSLLVGGKVQLHAPAKQIFAQNSPDIDRAIEERRVGAQVVVRENVRESYAYDDLEVSIESPNVITDSDVMRVVVSAELDEGRTVVLDVDPAMLSGPDMDLRYYDILDDGNETEVVFRQADSLADVLDATNDGGQPEYWVVEDMDGLQILVSIPHWSAHAITVASIGEFVTQPSVIVGVGAGLVGVGIAAYGMLRPRRLED